MVNILIARAQLLETLRKFFKDKGVLEVETPLLCQAAATDPFLDIIEAEIHASHQLRKKTYYLQTSPEFAMKRLLAEGSGPIFQICKAFRDNEQGKMHNPEFTMLEWYRPGFDHHQLMDEMDELLSLCLGRSSNEFSASRITYQELFLKYLKLDPLDPQQIDLKALAMKADTLGLSIEKELKENLTKDDWLNLLMTHFIEPHLGFEGPCMVYDYPETQAALSKIRSLSREIKVAERFEVYIEGIELANGYHELTDAKQQYSRFQQDLSFRKKLGKKSIPLDTRLIQALEKGLPDCAGVALGVDRLLMLQLKKFHMEEVLSFSIDEA